MCARVGFARVVLCLYIWFLKVLLKLCFLIVLFKLVCDFFLVYYLILNSFARSPYHSFTPQKKRLPMCLSHNLQGGVGAAAHPIIAGIWSGCVSFRFLSTISTTHLFGIIHSVYADARRRHGRRRRPQMCACVLLCSLVSITP